MDGECAIAAAKGRRSAAEGCSGARLRMRRENMHTWYSEYEIGDDFGYGPAEFAAMARRGSRRVCADECGCAGDGIYAGLADAGAKRRRGGSHRGTFQRAPFWFVRGGIAGGWIVYWIYRDLGAGVSGGVYALRGDWVAAGGGILGARARDGRGTGDCGLRV